MSNIWNKFSDFYGGQFLARETYDSFCSELLTAHYPDKKIFNQNDFENVETKKLCVFYVSKFFTDGLNSSRKGQLRNIFNEFVEIKNRSALKIYAWVVCLPLILDDEEMKWWLDWKNKNTIKTGINIQIFDGNHLIELAKKYDIFNKYFNYEQIAIQKQEQITSDSTKQIEVTNEFLENSEKKNESSNEDKDQISILNELKQTENKEIDQHQVEEETEKIKPVEKENVLDLLVNEFNELKKLYDSTGEDKKEKIDKFVTYKNWQLLFKELEIDNVLSKDSLRLFHKAKHLHEVRKEYISAIKVYQLIQNNEDYKQVLSNKVNEIPKLMNECKQKSLTILYEVRGDIYSILDNKTLAFDYYSKAFNINSSDNTIQYKFYYYKGLNSLTSNPKSAASDFLKAKKIYNKKDENISKYIFLANLLNLSKIGFIGSFFAPFAYSIAYSVEPTSEIREKRNKSIRRIYFSSSVVLLVLVALFFIYKFSTINIYKPKPSKIKYSKINKPLDAFDVALAEGDSIMKKITYSKIHLIDTAINAYKRAISYSYSNDANRNSVAISRYNNAKNYRQKYYSEAQSNVLRDTSYYIPMRRYSDGLQLVKYLFKPNEYKNGKYGYIDSNKIFVIPPIYDFDLDRMYMGKENFNNGYAMVCLFLTNNDTMYMFINKKNEVMVSKIKGQN